MGPEPEKKEVPENQVALAAPVDSLVTRHGGCDWDAYEAGLYETQCGSMFVLNDGTPAEGGMKFCPYCGGVLNAM